MFLNYVSVLFSNNMAIILSVFLYNFCFNKFNYELMEAAGMVFKMFVLNLREAVICLAYIIV